MRPILALFGRPAFLAKFHAVAAWMWLALGVFGLTQYVLYGPKHAIAASIPWLFFISVYANCVGHWSSNQAARVEVKQDEEIERVS